MENQTEHFTINYQNVANAPYLTFGTRRLARKIMNNPYMVVGEFFQSITMEELDSFVNLAGKTDDDSISELLLISEMLSRSEGVYNTDEEVSENVGFLRMLVAAISLDRKKMVKVNYENISFSRDMMNRVLVEPL